MMEAETALHFVWLQHLISNGLVQAGVWDIDGTGMQAIEDPDVDLGIRKVLLSPLPRLF